MKFASPLLKGKFIKRYKRFFADIEYKGEVITAHTPNTGSMKGCLFEGGNCYFTFVDDPKRKLKYTLQMLETPSSWVGVNTGLPNKLVEEAYRDNKLSNLLTYDGCKPEAKLHDKTRIDFAFWDSSQGLAKDSKWSVENIKNYKFHFIEVKNVTLVENNTALFPDAVTTRGQKHIDELVTLMQEGHTCELVFTVQRSDGNKFSPAKSIDATYAEKLQNAAQLGLIISPYVCDLSENEIYLNADKKLEVDWT